jgi:transcription antitermination factor NusG
MGEACLDYNTRSEIAPATADSAELHGQLHPWYAVKVRTGGELSTLVVLQNRGFDPYCPTHKEKRRYSDRVKAVDTPIFPGYLFCRFDVQKRAPILSCPGVQHIVGIAGAPLPVPEEEIRNVRRVIEAGGTARQFFKKGQQVCVTHGPLAGVEGLLVTDQKGDRLVVSIGLLTRSASLYINKNDVSPVSVITD